MSSKVRAATRIVAAGLVAGTIATAVQLLLWDAAGADAMALLWRDSRLTAALVLGTHVLTPSSGDDGAVLLAATVIHVGLSVLFAALLFPFADRWSSAVAMLAGAAFGALLYVLNLHVLTGLFPWFTVARGAIALAAHLAFGISAMFVLGMRLPVAR